MSGGGVVRCWLRCGKTGGYGRRVCGGDKGGVVWVPPLVNTRGAGGLASNNLVPG